MRSRFWEAGINSSSELENGTRFTLSKGMTYVVSDNLSSHRSSSTNSVKLLIIDGGFLKNDKKSPIRGFSILNQCLK